MARAIALPTCQVTVPRTPHGSRAKWSRFCSEAFHVGRPFLALHEVAFNLCVDFEVGGVGQVG